MHTSLALTIEPYRNMSKHLTPRSERKNLACLCLHGTVSPVSQA